MAHGSIKNLNIDGNVIISGSTTSIDVQQLTTDDTNITLNDVPIIITSGALESGPLDTNANAGGLTLLGGTFAGGVHTPSNKTWNWLDATDSWTSSDHIDLATGKEYKIDTTSVLTATTLGSGVVNSSLTSVGTLTNLQVGNVYIAGTAGTIGVKTTDEDLITLTNNTVTVAGDITATGTSPLGVITAREFVGGGASITGLSTSNIAVPGSPNDFLYNNAGAWGGITPPISITLGGTGANNATTARTNLELGTMAVETATDYLTVANDLSEVGNSTARTNLGLGTTDSPKFGGVGTGTVTIEATPSSGGTVAPTFSGVSFKSVPVASGSGHKWVVGNEQDGDLAFSYFTINDAGANTSSAVGYITANPANTRLILGNTGGTPVNVVISGLGYPTADGTANQVLTTDGSAGLTFGTPLTTNITEGTNLYYTDARADARIAAAYLGHLIDVSTAGNAANRFVVRNNANTGFEVATPVTTHITEGTNLYYTDARADARIALQVGANLNLTGVSTSTLPEGTNLYYTNARADARIAAAGIEDLDNVTITTPAVGQAILQYTDAAGGWVDAILSTSDVTEGSNLYYTNARADARIVNAGSANWNTAYTDTNAATDAATNSTIVKRGATGNIAVSKLTADNGVILGTMPSAATGGIQWTGTDFHGYDGSAWVSLTSAAVAQLSGAIATFTTTQTITSTTYADVPGYTASITVTGSSIINAQINLDARVDATIQVTSIKLVRVVSGTPTDLFIDESNVTAGLDTTTNFNIVYADTHGQPNGTVITYKLMAKVDAGILTINPNGTNAQIFAYELTTSPISVTSVNGASGIVVLDTDDISEGSSNLYYTDARADARVTIGVNAVIDSAPGTLDTLNELAAAMGDDANYAATITTALTGKLSVASDLSDVASVSLSRTNLGLGTTDSPNFGGEGVGTTTITATPSSSGTVAPTFSGVSFKSVPVASGSGHKWVVGNEQDGDLAFSYFTIDDAGANTSSAVGYITADPTNTRVVLGNTGSTPVNVVISGLGYPTADGTANQVLTTDGSNQLTFATPSTSNITEGTNLYYTDAKADARADARIVTAGKLSIASDLSDVASVSLSRTNLGLGTTDSPNFGGEGVGTTTITATPSSGGSVAPTFAGVSFKSVPVASGAGHKWVIGNEQDGDLAFSYFTIDDAGANTSSAVGYITADPTNNWIVLGQAGSTPVQVILSGIHYPIADGTANQILTTDGSNQVTFATPSTTNITEGTNLYYNDTRARGAVSVIPSYQLESVNLITPGFAGSGYQNIPSVYIDAPAFTGPTWTIIHGLGQKYVNFELIDTNHNVINTNYNSPTITYVDANTLAVNWNGVPTDGFINVIKSRIGHNISADLQAAGNIWTINHTLTGTEGIVNLDVVQNNISYYGKTGFPLIEYTSETQSRVIFPTGITPSGYAVVHNSYLNAGAVGSGHLHTQGAAATTWTITHNLGRKHLNVDVAVLGSEINSTDFSATIDPAKYYNIRGLYDYPTINFVDENSLTITFLTTTAGKAIITGDDMTEMTSLVQAIGVSHMELGDSTPATCPPVTINNGGSGFVASDVGKVYTVTGGTGTSATVTISEVLANGNVTVAHSLGQKYINVEFIDADNTVMHNMYNRAGLTYVDTNNIQITYDKSPIISKINVVESDYVSGLQSSANTWTITHSLSQSLANVDVIYNDDKSARGSQDYPLVEYTDANNVKVIFPTGVSKSGYVAVNNSIGTSNSYEHTNASATTWTVTHNLGSQYVNVDIAVLGSNIASGDYSATIDSAKYYNIKGLYDHPEITFVDANSLTITFPTAIAGKAIISEGTTLTIPGSAGPGRCTGVTLTTGGDYTALPSVTGCATTTSTGTGTGLTLDLNFRVKNITLTAFGAGYQLTPTITIGAPTGTCGTKTTATGQIITAGLNPLAYNISTGVFSFQDDIIVTPAGVSDKENTSTGAFILPTGTTAERPGTPVIGMMRFNTTTVRFEGYNGTIWVPIDTLYS